jgi:hypothetical protein
MAIAGREGRKLLIEWKQVCMEAKLGGNDQKVVKDVEKRVGTISMSLRM